MNTNNKEAIQILQGLLSNMSEDELGTAIVIKTVISLLQDNEDTEVQDIAVKENTCLCKEDNCTNCEYVGCRHVKPSSKVEKLNRLMVDVEQGENLREAMIRLIELIEDEE